MAEQITQAEIVEYAQLQKESKRIGDALKTVKEALVAKHKAGATQEPGPYRVEVKISPNPNPSYKEVVEAVKKLNATYVNGGGKARNLNERIPALIEATIDPESTKTAVTVEANV
jgi:hypothetical protein